MCGEAYVHMGTNILDISAWLKYLHDPLGGVADFSSNLQLLNILSVWMLSVLV